jgi:hypothetical protein
MLLADCAEGVDSDDHVMRVGAGDVPHALLSANRKGQATIEGSFTF